MSTCFCSYTALAATRVTKQNLATSRCAGADRNRQRRHPLVYPPLSIDSTLNTAGYLLVDSVATGVGSCQNAMAHSHRDQRGDPLYIGLWLHSVFYLGKSLTTTQIADAAGCSPRSVTMIRSNIR